MLLVWSAADEGGLGRIAKSYSDHFRKVGSTPSSTMSYLQDLAYTLCFCRSSLPWKSFTVTDNLGDLQHLQTCMSSPNRASTSLGSVFIFTGQGAQYGRMGVNPLSFSVFRNTLQKADEAFRKLGCSWRLFGIFLTSNTYTPYNAHTYLNADIL